jgi:prepilin-type N-terminal cleavage/methylation domain-containing protein
MENIVAPMMCLRGSSVPVNTRRKSAKARGFTLLELLLVMAIIAIAAAFLIPALSSNSSRALDGATHQFAADLENARLIAIAERTRTRVLLPTNTNNFANPGPGATPWPSDISSRGYVITSQKKTETLWKQRGKWNRFPQGVAIQNLTQSAPTPTPTAIPIDVGGSGVQTFTFSGPYIEFLANGSCNLDPAASPAAAVTLADGFVGSSGTFVAKNKTLRSTITIDPLTGSVLVQ